MFRPTQSESDLYSMPWQQNLPAVTSLQLCTFTLLENLTNDAIAQLFVMKFATISLYVMKYSTISLYLTKLYVTKNFALASSVKYS